MVTKESKNGREIFVILDANSIVHRAFHSFPSDLETSGGLQVNAAFGFTSMFLKVLELFKPKYIACAFDTAKPTFRHTIYSDYKATRKPTDQSLIDQFPVVEDIVNSFNVPILKKEGYEADDVIGTIAGYVQDGKWSNSNVHLCIVTGDNDMLQLISDNVSVVLPQGSFRNLKEFMRDDVCEKLGVFPEQVVDYKALVGDASDNIPGVKGIGAKTASGLIQEHGSLDGIYANLDKLKPRFKKLLEEGAEQAGFSKDLAKISMDVPIDISLEACLQRDFDRALVIEKFAELEFRTLVNKIPDSLDAKNGAGGSGEGQFSLFSENLSTESIENFDVADFKLALERAREVVVLFLDIHETGLDEFCLLVRCFSEKEGVSEFFIKSGDVDKQGELVSQLKGRGGSRETLFYGWEEYLSKTSESHSETLPCVENVHEAKVLAHIESSGRKNNLFANLCFEYLSRHLPDVLPLADYSQYFDFLKEIHAKIKEELVSREIDSSLLGDSVDFFSFTSKIENTLSIVLASMEKRGVLMNVETLKDFHKELEKEIGDLVDGIYYDVGHEFNINSTQQLADVLFNELHLEPGKKTKTSFSTKEDVLKNLVGAHPVVSKILEYRQKTKIMNTYLKVYLTEVENKVIHTDFKQTGTTSGRLSSVNPNMQNLPIGNEISDKLRKIFIPRPGFLMVSADYSQIDLRVMAHLSEDLNLMKDFDLGKDVHLATAARILDKKEKDISSEDRRVGKVINFGIIYGLTAFGLSQGLGISVEKARDYINEYFENYSGIANYINTVTKDVQNTRFVQTLLGRRRYVPGVNSRNIRIKNAAIREAINMPVQGGSADIMKLAIVELYKLILEKYEGDAFLLLQIHDEVIFEVKEELVEEFEKDVKVLMESVINLKVPLSVHISHGSNMSELK